jgi:hypothetical protein
VRQTIRGGDHHRNGRRHRHSPDQSGFSSTAGLVAMGVSLFLVTLLLVFSLNGFSGSSGGSGSPGGGGGASATPSILSHSSAETQIKLCSEGRDSTYGDPPTPTQQSQCVRQLLGGIGGVGSNSGP